MTAVPPPLPPLRPDPHPPSIPGSGGGGGFGRPPSAAPAATPAAAAVAAAPPVHRPDGRSRGGTLRPLSAVMSPLSRPDGSAQFSSGNTKVLAAVYGPVAPRSSAREDPTGCIISMVWKHGAGAARGVGVVGGGVGSGVGSSSADAEEEEEGGRIGSEMVVVAGVRPGYGATERELERFVGDAVASCVVRERYPRTVVEVVVQVVRSDGSVLGAAMNAASLALLDAGIEMRFVPTATTCLVLRAAGAGASDDLRLDPTAEEEAIDGAAVAVVVTDGGEGETVLTCMTFGNMSMPSLLSCFEGASRAGKAVLAFMRLAVEQKVAREAQTLWSS